MVSPDIRTGLRAILAEQFAVLEANLSDVVRLVEDLGADSLDLVEVLMSIEDTWGLCIPAMTAEDMTHWTVGQLELLVTEQLRLRAS